MSVRALTNDAHGLLDEIKREIDEDHIVTWEYNRDGDFTHTASGGQWKNKAWFRPVPERERLRLRLLRPKNRSSRRISKSCKKYPTCLAHPPHTFRRS